MVETAQNRNAIQKARKIKCSVHILPNRSYLVTTPKGHRYTVRMVGGIDDRRGFCTCAAGSVGVACYHLPKAAMVDDLTSHMRPTRSMRRAA